MAQQQQRSTEVDELFEVKTYFYIGAFQQCLNEIQKMSRIASLEKDCFMWRAYIAQNKFSVVLDGISENAAHTAPALTAIRKFAEFMAQPKKRIEIVQWFDDQQLVADAADMEERGAWCTAAATVYYNEGMYESALKVVHGRPELECLAMAVQSLLRMNRLDVARKVLARMQERDDDATLTQLALAWVNIETGGEKLQDAYYIFQDFADKFVATTILLNGQAVCHLGQHKYDEAAQVLRNALDKDPNNYDTLVNLIALAEHQPSESGASASSADTIQRYLSQIKESHRGSQLMIDLEKHEADFKRLCLKYSPSVAEPPTVTA